MNNVWLLTETMTTSVYIENCEDNSKMKTKSKVKDLQLSQIRKYAEYFDEDVKEEIVNKKNLTLTLWLISAIYAIYLFSRELDNTLPLLNFSLVNSSIL